MIYRMTIKELFKKYPLVKRTFAKNLGISNDYLSDMDSKRRKTPQHVINAIEFELKQMADDFKNIKLIP